MGRSFQDPFGPVVDPLQALGGPSDFRPGQAPKGIIHERCVFRVGLQAILVGCPRPFGAARSKARAVPCAAIDQKTKLGIVACQRWMHQHKGAAGYVLLLMDRKPFEG